MRLGALTVPLAVNPQLNRFSWPLVVEVDELPIRLDVAHTAAARGSNQLGKVLVVQIQNLLGAKIRDMDPVDDALDSGPRDSCHLPYFLKGQSLAMAKQALSCDRNIFGHVILQMVDKARRHSVCGLIAGAAAVVPMSATVVPLRETGSGQKSQEPAVPLRERFRFERVVLRFDSAAVPPRERLVPQ